MTQIAVDLPVVTLINVFTVEPERQQALVDLLIEATERTMRHQPGFVAANIHRSLDGRHVTNYAQWESEAAFLAMLANPEARAHMGRAYNIATLEGYLYQVVSTHELQRTSPPPKDNPVPTTPSGHRLGGQAGGAGTAV